MPRDKNPVVKFTTDIQQKAEAQSESFAARFIAAGFTEFDKEGKEVTGSDYSAGWNGLSIQEKRMASFRKGSKMITLSLIYNGNQAPIKDVRLIEGVTVVFHTTEGTVPKEILNDFLDAKEPTVEG